MFCARGFVRPHPFVRSFSQVKEREDSVHQTLQSIATSAKHFRKQVQEKFPHLLADKYSKTISLDDLGKKIGTIIQLPSLPNQPPKGFENPQTIQHFLLTKQRFKLCQELADFAAGKTWSAAGGFVPSGPHGIGKSSIGLLLASFAFVNEHYLIYIVISNFLDLLQPAMRQFVQHSPEQMALQFLKNFLNFNADLLDGLTKEGSPPLVDSDFEQLLLPRPSRTLGILDFYEDLLNALAIQTARPVTYIFDEHNELFKKHYDKDSATPLQKHPEFLSNYTRWTGSFRGVFSILFY
jgi:hypothetical protein